MTLQDRARTTAATRAEDLAARYTAAELARLLADHEEALASVRERLAVARAGLGSVVTGHWTSAGAVDVARRALHESGGQR